MGMKWHLSGPLVFMLAITTGLIVLWQATGGDYYTKYEVVEQVKKEIDPDDPLLLAGFYEDESVVETVRRDQFRFGLLPTPSGILDKHIVSVVSIAGPIWTLTFALMFFHRKRREDRALEN